MRRILIVSFVVALCVFVGVAYLRFWEGRKLVRECEGGSQPSCEAFRMEGGIVSAKSGQLSLAKSRTARTEKLISLECVDDSSVCNEVLAKRIDRAQEEEDFALAQGCVEAAAKSKDVSIRQSMVDTLGFFGERGLAELMTFLSDSDEEVRESALRYLRSGIPDIEDEKLRILVVEGMMKALDAPDFLSDMSDAYVGIDEKLAVESLARIIMGKGSPNGIKQAKETYELVTGEVWEGEENARRWLAEEYEPQGKGN